MKSAQTTHVDLGNSSNVPYKPILLLLCLIFAARVFIQFALQWFSVDWLPGFDLWHSEAMPYALLFTLQCLLLGFMIWGAVVSPHRKIRPRLGAFVCFLGLVYWFAMLSRLIIGLGQFSDLLWFEGAVPTAIHFILIAYVFVLGANLRGYSTQHVSIVSRTLGLLGYPTILITGYFLFTWILDVGAPLMFAAYLTVLVGVTIILVHETFAPHRQDWRPDKNDIVNDGLFLAVVQIAIPALLKASALALILWLSSSGASMPMIRLWPHESPVLLQVILMLVTAEFFRYWIHRASHTYIPLWKLHAVHHAANKLYTINVGRFHPFDKALQFLGDTLPFLLFGVAPEVFAAYFVLYALNGFYQHSNAYVKLGPLNWVIAGPELHRWHHSANYLEANANFGNNLILWDAVFGTRYLPKNRAVETVGISNPNWPGGFFAQLTAPFTMSTGTNRKTVQKTAPKTRDADE